MLIYFALLFEVTWVLLLRNWPVLLALYFADVYLGNMTQL